MKNSDWWFELKDQKFTKFEQSTDGINELIEEKINIKTKDNGK